MCWYKEKSSFYGKENCISFKKRNMVKFMKIKHEA